MFAQKELGAKLKRASRKSKQPAWKERLEKQIKAKRSDLSILTELSNGKNINPRKRNQLNRKYGIKNNEDLLKVKEQLKQ